MKFDWRHLGFACVITVFALMARLSYSAAGGLWSYAPASACMLPFVSGAVVYLSCEWFLGQRAGTSPARGVVVGALAGTVAFAGFLTVLLGAAGAPGSASAVGVVAGSYALFGVAMASSLLGWGEVACGGSPERAVAMAAAAWVASVFMRWPVIACTSPPVQCALLAACFFLGTVLLALSVRSGAPRAADARIGVRPRDALRTLAGPALLGLCLAMFHTGAVAIPTGVPLGGPGDAHLANNPAVKPIGCVIAAALVAAVLAVSRRRGRQDGVAECVALVVPVCIVCIGCFAFTRMVDVAGAAHGAVSVLNNVGIMGIMMLFLPDAAGRARQMAAARALLLVELLVGAAFFLAGYAATLLLGDGAFYVLIFLALVFSMAIALGAAAQRHNRPGAQGAPSLEERCDALALEGGLTGRERDALVLLVRGYRDTDIAQKLGISPSTAHTYRKAVYAKLDVHRGEELILFVLGHDDGSGERREG